MDYEKAYKAVLKTVTQWIKDGCTDKEKICLECVFPELRESEDERITRAINNMLPFIPDESYANNGVTKEGVLNWLEKQKEPKHAPDDLQKSFEAGQTSIVDNPEQYGLCKKAEWSEEDERIVGRIQMLLDFFDRNYPADMNIGSEIPKYISWLKSLRPSWKPSEELLSALHTAAYLPEMEFYGGLKDKLRELHEQLKSL